VLDDTTARLTLDDTAARFIVGALAGAAVGLERQWAARTPGRPARFGGLRTFTLIGLVGAVAGWLWTQGAAVPASLLVAAAGALVVAGYVAASRVDVDATTEVAALVVLAAGVLAGVDRLALAGGLAAATTLLLAEKPRLHGFVARIDGEGFRAGVRFAVLALVVLPLVPEGPFGTWGGGIRPRSLWLLVLVFAGLSFAGYVARTAVSKRYGVAITGLLGGLLSSTGVTLAFARAARARPEDGVPLAQGVLAACTVLVPRVLAAVAVLAPALVPTLARHLAAAFVVGAIATLVGLRSSVVEEAESAPLRNPLQLGTALQMAAMFQVVLVALHEVRQRFGGAGLRWSAVLLGLTDVDALTASMATQAGDGLAVDIAAAAIAIGIVANTMLKLGLAVAIGRGRFRLLVGAGLAAVAAAILISLRAAGAL
jgi:uncharacterized membrane protein (DUF4010 family)